MKREIKFRAWDKSENQMSYSDMEFYDDMVGFRFKHWGIDVDTIDDIELMQYTGLKDKNGKEIYEGDILRYVYSDLLFNWLISFYDGAFIFQSIGIDGYLMDKYRLTQSNCLDREVIGNIYENPELLW